MINERLRKRLKKDRPTTTITMRIPVDVVESLKAIAPTRGFTAYQTLLKGYISDADQDSFTVVDSMTGSRNSLAYADTSSVKKAGSGISGKTWIILGAAAVGAIVTWVIVKPVLCDGGAQTRGPC